MNGDKQNGNGAHGVTRPTLDALANLSAAQRVVLRGIAEGKKPNQILDMMPADYRGTERGVRWHREQVFRKLKIHSIAEATRIAMRAGLLL